MRKPRRWWQKLGRTGGFVIAAADAAGVADATTQVKGDGSGEVLIWGRCWFTWKRTHRESTVRSMESLWRPSRGLVTGRASREPSKIRPLGWPRMRRDRRSRTWRGWPGGA